MANDIPDHMKAVQLEKHKEPYTISSDVAVPHHLGPDDVLVKIAAASHCHTDSMVARGDFKPELPCIASHEGSGTVVKIGAHVRSIKPGDRVMCGLMFHPCKSCPDCLDPTDKRQYCPNVTYCGVTRNGFFAEYAIVDAAFTNVLPDEITFESAAPLACAGRTIWRGVKEAGLKAGQTICFVGSGGGLGHLGIQFAKALGLRVIGIDARDDGLALSREMGADLVLDARKGKDYLVEQVQKVADGLGAHATVTISDAPGAAAIGCAVTRMHGLMVEIAQPEQISVPFHEIIFRDIRIRGSLLASRDESQDMLETIAANGIVVKKNVFEGLDKIEELIKLVRGGEIQGKAIIVVDRKQIEAERKLGAKY